MSSTAKKERRRPQGPVLTVTGFDRAAAFVIAAVLGTALAAVTLAVAWAQQHEWKADDAAVPLELVEISGGVEDGAENETLDLKSDFEETPDPSLAEIRDDQTEIQPMLEAVVDLSDRATDMAREQVQTDAVNTGTPGSATGTGRRALGMGPGSGGMPREQRWFVSFTEGGTTSYYARQLDFFKIELGALMPDGKLVYLTNLTSDTPTVRRSDDGSGENRLYFTWQGGGRRIADIELFRKAGIDVGAASVFHFYSKEAENQLAQLEADHAKRPTRDIRRTYFSVQSRGANFEFVVTRQAFFR